MVSRIFNNFAVSHVVFPRLLWLIGLVSLAGALGCSRSASFTGRSDLNNQPTPESSPPENDMAKKTTDPPSTASRESISCDLSDVTIPEFPQALRFNVKFKVLGDWDTAELNGIEITESVSQLEFGIPSNWGNLVLRGTVNQGDKSVQCEQTVFGDKFYIQTEDSSVTGYANGLLQARFNITGSSLWFNPLPGQAGGRGIFRVLYGLKGTRGKFHDSRSGKEIEVLIDGEGQFFDPAGQWPYDIINFL